MPFQNLISDHFTPAERTQFINLMQQMEALLQPKLQNLSKEELRKYKQLNNRQILFIEKDKDYHNGQSSLDSPDVDWAEFDADYEDRKFLEGAMIRLEALTKAMEETKRLHDYDNLKNARVDMEYAIYKDRTEPGAGKLVISYTC